MSAPTPSLWSRVDGFVKAHWLAILLVLAWTWWLTGHDIVGRNDTHEGRKNLAYLGMGLTFAYYGLQIRPLAEGLQARALQLWRFVAVLGILYGAFNYYGFDRKFAEGYDDYTDITYYYLNSKYFDELGYTRLYEAMLLADMEGPKRVAPKIAVVRSLVTYEEEPAREALRNSDAKEHFTPARWEAFKADTDYFLKNRIAQHGIRGLQRNFFVDHGYNPPPPWTLVGGTLSNLVGVEHLKWITSIDLVLVLMLFVAIGWFYGPDVALIAAVWYVATFSSRWPVLTQSLLRFDWVVALAGGMVALKAGKNALGGGLLTWSALSRVFPGIFGVPIVAKIGWDFYKTRALAPWARQFIAGAAGTLIVAVALSWAYVGTQGWIDGIDNVVKHNGAEAYSSQKVGLGDALFYRGETTRKEMIEQKCGGFERLIGSDCETHGNIYGKSKILKEAETELRVLGLGAIVLVCVYAIRSKRPLHQLPPLAALPLFVLTNPSYYYYILRIVLVLFHAEDLKKRSNVVGLAWLFAMEVVSHYTKLQGYERYTTTALMSWMFVVYFAVVGILMLQELPKDEAEAEPASR